MTGSEQDSTSSLSFPNDMAGGRRAQYAILSDENLLDSICSPNLGNQLYHLRVVESSISSNDKEAAFCALGDREEDAGDESLTVMGLLEDGNFFAKA